MSPLTPRVHEAGRSTLEAYDFGAHLASWQLDGQPVIWCSPAAVRDGSAPIRGGVPICFPWFAGGRSGDRKPSHGVVRTATWRPADPQVDEVWAWELSSQDVAGTAGSKHLGGSFHLRYAVSLTPSQDGDAGVRLSLAITNPGPGPLAVEAALHTYLSVSDVAAVEILGLDGAAYLDKVTGTRAVMEGPLHLTTETDRVYDRSGTVTVDDPGLGRRLQVEPVGATQTVIWNPGADKGLAMSDLGAAWRSFVCVETAATGDLGLVVPSGQTHLLRCVVRAQSAHV